MSLKKILAAGAMGLALLTCAPACKKQPANFTLPAVTLEDKVRLDTTAKEVAAIPDYWAESDSAGYGRFDHKKDNNYYFTGFWSYKKDGSALQQLTTTLGEVVEFSAESTPENIILKGMKFNTISDYIVFAKGGKAVKILLYNSYYISRMNEIRLAEVGKK